ncbi:MAG TPA: universal stress protein [Cyclobacteriaceae bacterium]|nr:universal stress protein [Cyclobacteriaceae bacterium]HNP06260.1 universal stress protein [Cyclobacteriaceae bacterium]
MTILVPTDFSKPSKVAALYAAQLAKKAGAELVIATVAYGQASSRAMMVSQKLDTEMRNIALKELEELTTEIKSKVRGKLTISTHVLSGFPVTQVIQRFVKRNEVDLIVMGTRGATGLQKVLIGSNAAAMIQSSSVPVIIVPHNATFKGFKKIVYATDLIHIDEELSTVSEFAKLFNAKIDVLHVIPEASSTDINVKQIKSDLVKKMKYEKISFHLSKNDAVPEAIDNFMVDRKADILIMFTHKLSFFEKLFSRSVTRKLAFHSYIPMLTFNKDNLK